MSNPSAAAQRHGLPQFTDWNWERRNNGRVRYQAPLMVRGGSHTFKRASSRDFTEDGARLVVQECLPAGASVIVNLKLDSQPMLSLLGTVVWARPSKVGSETEVGVRFQDGCQADRRILHKWLHQRRLTSTP